MRVLGMSLWPKKLSDEQYVERVRKRVRMTTAKRFFYAIIGLGFFALIIWMVLMSIQLLGDISNWTHDSKHPASDAHQQMIYAAYSIAMMLGFMVGLYLSNTFLHIMQMVISIRQNKLLVEFWDALPDVEKARFRQRSD